MSYETIALTGDTTAGMAPGSFLAGFRSPVLTESGHVAFFGVVGGAGVNESNDTGIWATDGSGELQQIAREGGQAAGFVGDARHITMGDPWIDESGNVYYATRVFGSSLIVPTTALWRGPPGGSAIVAREDEPVLGLPGNPDSERLVGVLASAGDRFLYGTSAISIIELIQGDPSGLRVVAARGDPASGLGPNDVLHRFDPFNTIWRVAMNRHGATAFQAEHRDAAAINGEGVGIWKWDDGDLQLVAVEGAPAPGVPGATLLGLHAPSINGPGEIAFSGRTTLGDGVWRGGPGDLELVAMRGDPPPGVDGDRIFTRFFQAKLDNTGGMVFSALASIPGVSGGDPGIWAHDDAGLRLVAYPGDPLPGLPEGATISSIIASLTSGPLVNARGDIVFSARASLPTGGFSTGYWAEIDGELIKIATQGDLIDVDDDPLIEDLRRVTAVGLINDTGGEDGQRSAWNNRRQALVQFFFDDGSRSVSLVTVVPEPGGVLIALVCCGAACVRRSRIG